MLGKGYAVSRLAQIEKLAISTIYYWGDIDQHGFEILASLRSRLPQTKSHLMDEETLACCRSNASPEEVEGTLSPEFVAANLTPDENVLWQKCANKHLRLEQENIPQEISRASLVMLATVVSDLGA